MTNILHSEIHLPIYKQGDDLDSCIVKNDNGSIDVKETLTKYSDLLISASRILINIRDNIPDETVMDLQGDTHFIGLSGDESIIKKLSEMNLVSIMESEEFSSSGEEESVIDENDLIEMQVDKQ